jgi:hypothetical protein
MDLVLTKLHTDREEVFLGMFAKFISEADLTLI